MASRNIESFLEYTTITDQSLMSGPNEFVNDGTQYRGYSWAQAWSVKRKQSTAALIKDFIILTHGERARFIAANHKFTPEPNANVTKYQTGWATLASDNAITDEELEFNDADKRAKYKDLYMTYVIPMRTDLADKMEVAMWATPNARMESPSAAEAREPFSILSLITADGLVPSGFTGLSTKFGINPTTDPNWQNTNLRFSDFVSEIERRLFRAKMLTDFKAPSGMEKGSFTGTPKDRRVVYGDLKSLEELRQILRDSNDRLSALGEYDGTLTYDRMPILWAEPLGDTSTAATSQKLFGINYDFLYPILHKDYFMKMLNPPYGGSFWKPHDMPLSNAVYMISRYNWWPRSLRRQWVISHDTAAW